MLISPSACLISVLLASAYLSFIAIISSLITPKSNFSSDNIALKCSIFFINSLYSSSIFCLSNPVSLCNLISKIAWAWISVKPNLDVNPSLASPVVLDDLIKLITASILSNAILKPSNICALASALFNSNTVLLVTTSFWNSI